MKIKHMSRKTHDSKRTPRWKFLLIILLVVAMPMFFSFARDYQIQQALITSTPEPQNTPQVQNQDEKVNRQ